MSIDVLYLKEKYSVTDDDLIRCSIIKGQSVGVSANLSGNEKEKTRNISFIQSDGNMSELIRKAVADFLETKEVVTNFMLKNLGKMNDINRDTVVVRFAKYEYVNLKKYTSTYHIRMSPLLRYIIKKYILDEKVG